MTSCGLGFRFSMRKRSHGLPCHSFIPCGPLPTLLSSFEGGLFVSLLQRSLLQTNEHAFVGADCVAACHLGNLGLVASFEARVNARKLRDHHLSNEKQGAICVASKRARSGFVVPKKPKKWIKKSRTGEWGACRRFDVLLESSREVHEVPKAKLLNTYSCKSCCQSF